MKICKYLEALSLSLCKNRAKVLTISKIFAYQTIMAIFVNDLHVVAKI